MRAPLFPIPNPVRIRGNIDHFAPIQRYTLVRGGILVIIPTYRECVLICGGPGNARRAHLRMPWPVQTAGLCAGFRSRDLQGLMNSVGIMTPSTGDVECQNREIQSWPAKPFPKLWSTVRGGQCRVGGGGVRAVYQFVLYPEPLCDAGTAVAGRPRADYRLFRLWVKTAQGERSRTRAAEYRRNKRPFCGSSTDHPRVTKGPALWNHREILPHSALTTNYSPSPVPRARLSPTSGQPAAWLCI